MARNNDKNNNPNKGNENFHEGSHDSPEMEKFKREKQEAIDSAKKMEAELAAMMEKRQDKNDVFADVSNFPQKNPEQRNVPEQNDLEKIFTASVADNVQHTFLRKQFPNFIRVCEEPRIGRNIPRDILALALGIAESLSAVVTLSGHVVVDLGKLVTNPRAELDRTKESISV